MKKAVKAIAVIFGVILLVVLGYVAYVFLTYDRIADGQELTPGGDAVEMMAAPDREYTIMTQNVGFGAYTQDFTFFMDGGESSRAASKDSVEHCIDGISEQVQRFNPDFIFFQEVDTDSTRSHHVDERQMLSESFDGYQEVFAVNYHSAYLMYPLTEPHGKSNSGILTLSREKITSALRRSLPISTSFSKFLDLDRCYSISRLPVKNGKELVLFNVHLSAYGGSDDIRKAQMTMVFDEMKAEYDKGNYCIAGGDFNHDFTGDSTQKLNGVGLTDFGWAQPFPAQWLPDGIQRCLSYDGEELIPTCRNCDVPYDENTFVIIVDGFLVSDNVTVTHLENIDASFTFTDHNPVLMRFKLNVE